MERAPELRSLFIATDRDQSIVIMCEEEQVHPSIIINIVRDKRGKMKKNEAKATKTKKKSMTLAWPQLVV